MVFVVGSALSLTSKVIRLSTTYMMTTRPRMTVIMMTMHGGKYGDGNDDNGDFCNDDDKDGIMTTIMAKVMTMTPMRVM